MTSSSQVRPPIWPVQHNVTNLGPHKNVIHEIQRHDFVFCSVDPSSRPATVHKNMIYNGSKGPKNPELTGKRPCIYAPGSTNAGSPGGGTIRVSSNVL